jgi:RNA polymerase sigma factor (sigma-70 family)
MTDPPPTRPVDPVSRELDQQLTRYADRVRRAVARYGLAGEVDEIFQEVRIRLWRAFQERGNIMDAPASYVYRTAVSATIDLIRRRRARREEQIDLDRPSGEAKLGTAPGANFMAEENELADCVNQEITRLPEDRALVVRMYLSGYPRVEIATIVGWSEPRTRHLIYRGLAQLRRRLQARGIGPEVIA